MHGGLSPPPSLLLALHLRTPRRFFLSNLHTAIPQVNHPSTTIISDRDKGLRPADDAIPLATRATCLGHLSRNLQESRLGEQKILNSAIRFALTEEKL